MNPVGLVPVALLLVPVALILRAHLWRAVLFGWPASLTLRAVTLAVPELPASLVVPGRELFALGFTLLGAHEENPRLGPKLRAFDFAHPDGTFATVDPGSRVYFINAYGAGDAQSLLLTAAFSRPTVNDPGLRAAGRAGDPLPVALARHRLRRRRGGSVAEVATLQKRIALARAYYGPSGAMELKRQYATSVLWVLAALLAVALAIFRKG